MLDVTKNPPELVLKGDDFFLREGDTSQSGNMPNIKMGAAHSGKVSGQLREAPESSIGRIHTIRWVVTGSKRCAAAALIRNLNRWPASVCCAPAGLRLMTEWAPVCKWK